MLSNFWILRTVSPNSGVFRGKHQFLKENKTTLQLQDVKLANQIQINVLLTWYLESVACNADWLHTE